MYSGCEGCLSFSNVEVPYLSDKLKSYLEGHIFLVMKTNGILDGNLSLKRITELCQIDQSFYGYHENKGKYNYNK